MLPNPSHSVSRCKYYSNNLRRLYFSKYKASRSDKSNCLHPTQIQLEHQNESSLPIQPVLKGTRAAVPGCLQKTSLRGYWCCSGTQQAGVQAGGSHGREQIEKGLGKSLAQMPRQKGNSFLCSILPPLPAIQGERLAI